MLLKLPVKWNPLFESCLVHKTSVHDPQRFLLGLVVVTYVCTFPLSSIVKFYRCRIVDRLVPAGIFWLNRPWLLLPVIKYLVFFNTFVFANSIFFASQFGPHSCFFSKTGFQGAVPLSWWVRSLPQHLPVWPQQLLSISKHHS